MRALREPRGRGSGESTMPLGWLVRPCLQRGGGRPGSQHVAACVMPRLAGTLRCGFPGFAAAASLAGDVK
eukprot:167631-Chlamydomonas_euryale.AAC.3